MGVRACVRACGLACMRADVRFGVDACGLRWCGVDQREWMDGDSRQKSVLWVGWTVGLIRVILWACNSPKQVKKPKADPA